MQGSFEGETVSRRRFMTGTVHAAGVIAGAAITLPTLGFALGPVFARTPATWQDIGPLSRFSDSDYTPVVITIEPGLGTAGESLAYVRQHNLEIDGPVKDKYDRVIAISSRCAHVAPSPEREQPQRSEGQGTKSFRNQALETTCLVRPELGHEEQNTVTVQSSG